MRALRQSGSIRAIVLIALAVSLLLLLLVPHATSYLSLTLICLTLLPIFLFAGVEPAEAVHPIDASFPVPQPARPALFQRPPPLQS